MGVSIRRATTHAIGIVRAIRRDFFFLLKEIRRRRRRPESTTHTHNDKTSLLRELVKTIEKAMETTCFVSFLVFPLLSPYFFLFEQQQTKDSKENGTHCSSSYKGEGGRPRTVILCCCCCCCHHHRHQKHKDEDDHHHRKAQRTVVDANKSHCSSSSSTQPCRDISLSLFRTGLQMPVARRVQSSSSAAAAGHVVGGKALPKHWSTKRIKSPQIGTMGCAVYFTFFQSRRRHGHCYWRLDQK